MQAGVHYQSAVPAIEHTPRLVVAGYRLLNGWGAPVHALTRQSRWRNQLARMPGASEQSLLAWPDSDMRRDDRRADRLREKYAANSSLLTVVGGTAPLFARPDYHR